MGRMPHDIRILGRIVRVRSTKQSVRHLKEKASNTRRYVDLHVHSTASDGTFSPEALVDYALQKQLAAFALTDHDTIDGLAPAIAYARNTDVEVIPGIELSTEYNGRDIHIVGLFIDYENPVFLEHLAEFCASRDRRNEKMAARLTEAGCPITMEELTEAFPDAVITRAHFARLMMQKGYIQQIKEAFEKYIGDNGPCFVPREKVTPWDGVRLIREAGGLAVLAHPVLYHMNEHALHKLLFPLKDAGLTAIEGLYATYNHADEAMVRRLASRHSLLLSGGSDFHGDNKPGQDMGTGFGNLRVPETILDDLRAVWQKSNHGK